MTLLRSHSRLSLKISYQDSEVHVESIDSFSSSAACGSDLRLKIRPKNVLSTQKKAVMLNPRHLAPTSPLPLAHAHEIKNGQEHGPLLEKLASQWWMWEHQLRSCGLLRSERNCWNSMKESREPECMPVSYDQVEWHKICLWAYVKILISPHNNLLLVSMN